MPRCEISAAETLKKSPGQLDGFLPILPEVRRRIYDEAPLWWQEQDQTVRNQQDGYEKWVESCFKAYVKSERVDRAIAWLNEAAHNQAKFDHAIREGLRPVIPWKSRWELVSASGDPDTRREYAMYYLTSLAGDALVELARLDYHPILHNLETYDSEDIEKARQIYAPAPDLVDRPAKWEGLAAALEAIAADTSQPEEHAEMLKYLALGWRLSNPAESITYHRKGEGREPERGFERYGKAEAIGTYSFFKVAFQTAAALQHPEHAKELLDATIAVIGTLVDKEYRTEMTLNAGRILVKRGL